MWSSMEERYAVHLLLSLLNLDTIYVYILDRFVFFILALNKKCPAWFYQFIVQSEAFKHIQSFVNTSATPNMLENFHNLS